jgi:phosphopantothenoylcysteine synthetase/decarboxylase
MKILVTAGATREPIDAVRFISNVSTGTTGAALADEFAKRGHTVLLLHGEGAAVSGGGAQTKSFSSAADLRAQLERLLREGEFDVVVMAAAVSDYRPVHTEEGKISSDTDALLLPLVRNEKILPELKSFALSRPPRVVGFKLTVGAEGSARRAAVVRQFATGGVDAVVHNDLVEIRAATVHPFWLWPAIDAAPVRIEGTPALAVALLKTFDAPSS